jgi:hypothetical protein
MDPLLGALGATALGQLGGLLSTAGLTRVLQREGKSMGHTSPQRVQELLDKVKQKYNLDVGYLHSPDIAGSNAGFSTRKNVDKHVKTVRELLKGGDKDNPPYGLTKKELRHLEKGIDELGRNVRKGGLVITGTHFKKPGTVEHELGHAIAASRGNPIEKAIIQKNIPEWSELYHAIPSTLAGLYGGGRYGPLKGALIGGLTGLATNAPTLYAEYSANKYGDQLLDESKPTQSKNTAYGTYLAGSAVPSALTGATFGLLNRKFKF